MGKKAVTAMVETTKGEGKNGGRGIVSSISDNREWTPDDRIIYVKISKTEEICVIASTYDSYADLKIKIHLRARELRKKIPPNFEVWACVGKWCMYNKIIDCREFAIVGLPNATKSQRRPLVKDISCMKKPSVCRKLPSQNVSK